LLGLTAALTMGAAVIAHAEAAPVYDADTMQQQNDYSMNDGAPSDQSQGQDLPMPPAPEQQGAYVPAQQPAASNAPTVAVVQDNAPAPAAAPPAPVATNTGGDQQRIKHIEQQVNKLQTDSSAARVEALQKEVQSLRGQVEQLTHQSQQMQDQQKSMYTDLDKRVSQSAKQAVKKSEDLASADNTADTGLDIKAGQKVTAIKKPATPDADTSSDDGKNDVVAKEGNSDQPNVAEEQQIYQTAYNQIKAKKYDDAVKTLQSMLKKYPSGQFASNAHYWLGELYGLMGKHADALTEFNTVIKDYPSSPRISDAQLKVGLIYAAQFNWSDAKTTFKKIINRYPGTASARLASDQLKQIKDAGH